MGFRTFGSLRSAGYVGEDQDVYWGRGDHVARAVEKTNSRYFGERDSRTRSPLSRWV